LRSLFVFLAANALVAGALGRLNQTAPRERCPFVIDPAMGEFAFLVFCLELAAWKTQNASSADQYLHERIQSPV
jgi:hypothetical protein